MIRYILLNFILILSMPTFASNISNEYNECVISSYYEQASDVQSCDFSHLRVNIGSFIRSCNMAAFKELPLDSSISEKIKQLKHNAFTTLNAELNNRLYECGYSGKINIQPNSGEIKILKFQKN